VERIRSLDVLSLVTCLGFLLPSGHAASQEISSAALLGTGITAEYGLGSYAVIDEYFSTEKYSGTLPYMRLNWSRAHEKAVYQLGLEARTSSEIRNYSVKTAITQFSFIQGFLYPLPRMVLFGRDLHLFLGPCSEIFILMNTQDLAVSALGFGMSVSALFSLGARAELVMPLSSKLGVEGLLQAGFLSLGIRAIDDETSDDAAAPKLLTALAGTNASLRLGLRYRLAATFSVRLAYQFTLTRITPWIPLLATSDTILAGLTWSF